MMNLVLMQKKTMTVMETAPQKLIVPANVEVTLWKMNVVYAMALVYRMKNVTVPVI